MAFEPFNLGQVFATAEGIKQARQQGTTDRLREKYLGLQIEGAQADQARQGRQEQVVIGQQKALQIVEKSRQILQQPDGSMKNYIETAEPDLVKNLVNNGFDWQTADEPTIRQQVTAMQNRAAQELGGTMTERQQFDAQNSVADKRLQQTQDFSRSQQENQQQFTAGENALNRNAKTATVSQFRPLSPQEIQQVGLPAGTSAQVDTSSGKIDVLSKRDVTGNLSPKDATVSKLKLTTISMARQQLARARSIFEQARKEAGPNAFGPGQGTLPTQQGKQFDAAINQMRGTWTSLKRVPGVGSMSDYESKMDASQFPGRNEWEGVIDQKLQGMEDQLALLENGYTGLLSGGSPEPQQPVQQAAPQQQQAPQQSQGIDERGYASLPSGTQYRAPDGTIRTKR